MPDTIEDTLRAFLSWATRAGMSHFTGSGLVATIEPAEGDCPSAADSYDLGSLVFAIEALLGTQDDTERSEP